MSQYGICQVAIAPIRSDASDQSEIVTQLLFGDYVQIKSIEKPWAHVFFPADNYEGYMDFKQLLFITEKEFNEGLEDEPEMVKTGMLRIRGPLGKQHIIFGSNLPFLKGKKFKMGKIECSIEDEVPEFEDSFIETAMRYLNTPYLWGGKGIFGIDCSGLTQVVAKAHGIYLPRDASQQCQVGQGVMFDARATGDLMYFINDQGIVHHVGILLNTREIIHAAGHVRIDKYDENGIFRADFDEYTHKFHSIKRIWIK